MSFKNIIFYCFVVFLNAGLYGQTFKTDAERLTYANELFEKGKFVEAERLFLESLSLNQTDPDLNFKYGTCLIYASEKKDESLRFLKYAVSKNADPRAHFYLGKALLLNYRFKEASDQFKIYKTKSSAADHVKLEVDLHIRMCENGRKLMNQLTELVVENKQRASLEKFYVSYDLSQIGGRIIVSEEFQSKHDKKLGYRSLIYFPPTNQDVIYYSSYGKDGATGLDLYAKKRLPNGEWGVEQLLPPQINTPYDEAYGFLHADQTTFYFCSKGHNSMGGFDVFKCSYDRETNSYGPAQNLDYKINTPDDDLMYVVDSLERNAYFASSRSSKFGFVDVYKVRVETYPMLNVILAGNFLNDVNPGDEATIKIEDPRNDEIIGMYSPNAQGKYVIILPKSGTYNFIVETKKSNKIHTSPVTIPPQMVMKPLKQKIMLVQNEGNEKLIIQNLFDEEVEDAEGIMADVMQQLANPNINIDQFDDSLLIEKDPEIYSNSKENEGNWTDADLKKMSEEMYLEAEKEALDLKEKTDGAYAVASIKAKESQEYAKAAEDILKTIDGIENPLDKQKQAAQAKEYNEKAKEASMMATTALNLGNRLTVETENAQKEAAESKKTNDDIVAALNEKDPTKAQQQLEIVKDRLKEIISTDAASNNDVVQVISAQAKEKKEEANREFEKAKEFRDEESKLNLRLNNLIAEQEKAKEKDKVGFDRQIEEIKEQIEQNKKWAEQAYAKAEKLDKEAEKLSKEAELMDDLLYEIENSTSPVLSQQEREILNQNIRNSSVEEKIGTNENSLSEFEPIDMSVLNNSTATTTSNSNGDNNSTSDTSNNSNNTTNTTNSTNDNGSNTNNTANNTTNDNGSNTTSSTNNNSNDNGSNTSNNSANTSEAISVPTIDFESNKTELARFENEKDPVVKAQKENEVYENWVNDINEKIQEIDALIPTATTQEDKDQLTAAKNTLENTKREVESKSAANREVIANNTNSNTNVTATTNATPTIPSTDFSSKKNELETISSEKDPKLKAEKENEIYENWVNEINEKLQEIDAQIPLLTSEEDKKNWVEAKNSLNNSKSEIERNIIANNNVINNASTVATTNTPDNASSTRTYIDNEPSNVKNTEGFKSLKNEVTNEKAVADDFENTVIPGDIYASVEAKNKVNEAESDRDKIIMIENEIAALNTNLENEKKAKKKEAISKEIDAKENEKYLSENQLGTKVFEADQIELKANDVALAALVEEIKIEVANYETDKNYIKANLLLQEAESQRRDAEVLYKKANSAETPEQKATLLIEAHKLNQAALQNQNNATTLLEQVNSSNYVAEYVDPSLNKNGNTKTVNTTVFEDGNTTNSTNTSTNTNTNTTNTNTNTNGTNTNTTANNNTTDVNNNSSNETNSNANTNSNTNSSTTNSASSDTNNSTSSNNTNSTNTNNSTVDNNTSTSTNTNSNTNTSTNTSNTANNNSSATNNSENNTTTSDSNPNNVTNTSTTSSTATTSNATITNPTSEDINSGKVSIENATKMAEKNAQSTVEKQEVANVVFSPTETVKEAHTVTTEVPVVEMNRNTEFESETAQKIAQTDVKTVAKLDDLTTQIEAKRKELDAATSDKEKAKITKEVENLEKNRAKEELKVSDDYQKAASIELGNATAQVTTSKDVIKNNIENTYLENQANEYENSANQLIADATKLRSEAEKEKDKQEKADMLKEAFSKEMEAANYLEKAADLKLQAELKENEIRINELIDVPENVEERLSTKLNQQAEDVRSEAAQMRQKAADLFTQSETAKGEDKFNLENQAETLNKSASRLENFATQLSNQSQQAAGKESEILAKNELLATLKTANVEEIRSNETYAKFNEVQKEIDSKTIEKSSLEGQKKGYENLAQQQEVKAKDIENQITSSTNEAEKVELNNQINELNEFARANREKASELNSQIEKLAEEINVLQVNQNGVIFNLTEKEKNDFEALALSNENKEPIKKTASISFGDLISSTYKPEKVENTIVLFDEKIVYSDANPIPINPGFPDGLFYKVQVGAFNKPIPNDVFKGFAPITADKLPNSNLIRYRVGYFNGYTIANDAKNQIRQMGYSDAFLVAIYDGQPITLSQARSIERGEIPEGLVASNTTNSTNTANTSATKNTNNTNNSTNTASNTTSTAASNSNNTTNTNTASTTTNNTNTTNNSTNNTASNSTDNGNNNNSTTTSNTIRTTEVDLGANAAKTNDADKIEGLFYTVQLGAYSKPIDATSVYNISPLVTKFVGQLYKYSTGIYRNIDDAVVRKNQVNGLGMADAFVTVYYNGERITIERANQLIAEKGESIFATDSSGGLKQLQPNASTSGTNSTAAVNSTTIPTVEVTSNGKFQIDLGTYSGEAPVDIANAMLIIKQFEIKTESKDASKRYYVGNFATQSDAQKVIDLYKENGVEAIKIINLDEPVIEQPKGPAPVQGVSYRVFLGTYVDGNVPQTRANTFIELAELGIVKIQDTTGETYYCGNEGLFSSAQQLLSKFTEKGISIAEIKAFQNGVEIPVSEAKALTGE